MSACGLFVNIGERQLHAITLMKVSDLSLSQIGTTFSFCPQIIQLPMQQFLSSSSPIKVGLRQSFWSTVPQK